MGKFIPFLLAFIGAGAGIGAGFALRPEPVPDLAQAACPCDCPGDASAVALPVAAPEMGETGGNFVKMNNQFVIPVVRDGAVSALVVLSLTLQMSTGGSEIVYQREPKLRDTFLRVLFDHANAGGFDGTFTAGPNMDTLRTALREAANSVLAGTVHDILITDIMRQDV
ncbi:flagellar basal body-associated FliL family protein [Sinisalibacter lacisalsi]|uniref:Flagellar protein FliL n=1 Tax=Sinisalibacter lacisalsi TaxID=1526570 RepID=A0ABQ1QCA7_9RHOB|nr:flagellar basal body-associated FliL family protein [Sinisalibacter lacisalsi]GGD22852.1 flagellar basal body-associated protein FliL [Sinisalibacter lacisalsi]